MDFEKATRMKFRYPYMGNLTTEDLWDLTVEELDSIFKNLNKQVKSAQEETLLGGRKTKAENVVDMQIEIVKRIVEVKLAEADERKTLKEKSERKQRLLSILASKQEAELQGKSTEDIQKMIDEL